MISMASNGHFCSYRVGYILETGQDHICILVLVALKLRACEYLDTDTATNAQFFRDECKLRRGADFNAKFPCTAAKPANFHYNNALQSEYLCQGLYRTGAEAGNIYNTINQNKHVHQASGLENITGSSEPVSRDQNKH
jgi:hypothetical protein